MTFDRNEYMRQYRAKNREKIQAYQRAYEEINKATRKLQKKLSDKNYRVKHLDKIKAKKRTPECRFGAAKSDAKKRGIDFNLTFEYWLEEVSKPCAYCGDQLGKRSETTVGCDRVHNHLGYVEGNVVSCCGLCNKIKNSFLTFEETMAAVQAILAVRKKNDILNDK